MSAEEKTQRCCYNCYHYGWFLGENELTCELTGRAKKRQHNYTNCRHFGLQTMMNGKVVIS